MDDTNKQALYALTPQQHATVVFALMRYAVSRGEKEVTNGLAGKDVPALAPLTTAHGLIQPLDFDGASALISALNHTGLDFSAIVPMFGELAQHSPHVAAAQAMAKDGEIEVDNPAVVSRGDDDGAYVMSWMWVSNTTAGVGNITDDKEED